MTILQEKMGATTQSAKVESLLRKVQPCQFGSYQEFMRALILESLSSTTLTFRELNCELFSINQVLFENVTREATAFFKLQSNKTQYSSIPDGPTTSY